MRIAIVSDIHGNRTAFDAVLADLRQTSPDLIFHGGDLADGGASPVEIADRIRDLAWPGVAGNTDELLFRPESLDEFAATAPAMSPLVPIIKEMAAWTRDALGEDRIAWLRGLPPLHHHNGLALVHASPGNFWRAPNPEANDAELTATYRPLDSPLAIHGHVHRPYIRTMPTLTVANTGSAGLPYDGDPRASYLLLDDNVPSIRRVEYEVARELNLLADSTLPHAAWVAKMLFTARPQMP
jgi:predicted phosphodiesterase